MSDRNMSATMINVRCMVDDVNAAIVFYNTHLGCTLLSSAAPAFAEDAPFDACPAGVDDYDLWLDPGC